MKKRWVEIEMYGVPLSVQAAIIGDRAISPWSWWEPLQVHVTNANADLTPLLERWGKGDHDKLVDATERALIEQGF